MKKIYAVLTAALLVCGSAAFAGNASDSITCGIKDAAVFRGISAAEDGSFAGWGQLGCTIQFNKLSRGKRLTVVIKGDAGTVVRVLFNNKSVKYITLPKSGKQTLVIPVYGDAAQVGDYLLHFPKGIIEFYSFKVEK